MAALWPTNASRFCPVSMDNATLYPTTLIDSVLTLCSPKQNLRQRLVCRILVCGVQDQRRENDTGGRERANGKGIAE